MIDIKVKGAGSHFDGSQIIFLHSMFTLVDATDG